MPESLAVTVPLRRVWMWALAAGVYSAAAVWVDESLGSRVPDIPSGIDAGLAFAITLIVVFRVNRAYERWWEARTLWGKLVNVSRNLAVKTRELHELDGAERRRVRDLIVSFCYGLKDHLRNQPDVTVLPGFKDTEARPQHLPSFVVRHIYAEFASWRSQGRLTDAQLWVLDAEARELLEVAGACERIKNTLMSVSWRRFVQHCVIAYLLVLPWGLDEDFGWFAVPISMLLAYFVIAGEGIAQYVEEPFGVEEDHVDLDGICAGIDTSVSEVLA